MRCKMYLKEKEPKSYPIFFRADEKTYKKINKITKAYRGNKSEALREAILNCKIESIEHKTEIIRQLKKIGNNINQIARKVNEGIVNDCSLELDQCNKELNKLYEFIYKNNR